MMSWRKIIRAGFCAGAAMLAAALVWSVPRSGWAQQEPAPAFETGETPTPAMRPGRPGGRGARIHQPADRPLRDRQGMGPGMGMGPGAGLGPGMGPGMGPGPAGGRRWEEALERLKTENPERYQRIQRIRELADQYRQGPEAEKKKIEKELRPLLEAELKAIQAENQKKIEELERRLNEEKRKQKEREQNWEAYLNFQFNRITGRDDYLHLPLGPWR